MLYSLYIFSIAILILEASKNHPKTSIPNYEENRNLNPRSGSLAEKMCKIYTEEACRSKRSIFQGDPESLVKIIGGNPAQPKQYPHMAAIGYYPQASLIGEVIWGCGGSLISEKFILTAAHCAESPSPSLIRLGKLNLPNAIEDPNEVYYTISKIIIHPDYISEFLLNDIALLKFQHLDTFTDYIRPICLNTLKDIPKQKFYALGWGRTRNDSISKELLAVQLNLQIETICQVEYSDFYQKYNKTSTICAGYLFGGKDTCYGDSGGPLQYLKKKSECSKVPIYTQIGITSFGNEICGERFWPAAFTRVSFYIPWIESIVWT